MIEIDGDHVLTGAARSRAAGRRDHDHRPGAQRCPTGWPAAPAPARSTSAPAVAAWEAHQATPPRGFWRCSSVQHPPCPGHAGCSDRPNLGQAWAALGRPEASSLAPACRGPEPGLHSASAARSVAASGHMCPPTTPCPQRRRRWQRRPARRPHRASPHPQALWAEPPANRDPPRDDAHTSAGWRSHQRERATQQLWPRATRWQGESVPGWVRRTGGGGSGTSRWPATSSR